MGGGQRRRQRAAERRKRGSGGGGAEIWAGAPRADTCQFQNAGQIGWSNAGQTLVKYAGQISAGRTLVKVWPNTGPCRAAGAGRGVISAGGSANRRVLLSVKKTGQNWSNIGQNWRTHAGRQGPAADRRTAEVRGRGCPSF